MLFGLQVKLIIGLVGLLIIAGFWIKHQLYQQGVRDASFVHVAMAAERSIKAERTASRATIVSNRQAAQGKIEVAALRTRYDRAVGEAKAAREAPKPGCPEPTVCSSDLPVLQP